VTALDYMLALLAVAVGVACVVTALRIASGLGRIGLLLVLLLVVLLCCNVPLPDWHDITGYLAPTTTEVTR
jgi:hypothetical protein